MKKIFVILMTICLLAGALSVTAFAADTEVDPADLNGIQLGYKVVIDEENITSVEVAGDDVSWWGSHRLGSIFGEGSLTAIIILGAIVIVASGACFVVAKKKKSNKTKGGE